MQFSPLVYYSSIPFLFRCYSTGIQWLYIIIYLAFGTVRRASTGAIRSLSFPNQSPAAAALAMTQESFYRNGDGLGSRPSIRCMYIHVIPI